LTDGEKLVYSYYFENLWLIWIFSSFLIIRYYIYLIAHRSKFQPKPIKEKFATPRVIFQVTTKGNIRIVQDTINRVNSVCSQTNYTKYEIWTVTDAQEKFEGCRTIVVPKDYSCNAVCKGRALQFAVETRKKEGLNSKDLYVFHLDDESIISKQTLCSILSYLEDNPKPISEGLIIYPVQKEEKIKVSNLMDTLRPFYCSECLDFMSGGNPAYIHGSNLLLRSDIEEEVGWDNGKTFAEDTLFAINAKSKFGSKIFGWHGGVIEEKSPLNLKDLVKQRKRWYYGLIQNMKYFPPKEKARQIVRALVWPSGLISGIVSVMAFFLYQSILNPSIQMSLIRFFFIITSVMWLLSYQIGAYLNGKYLPVKKRINFHLLALVFAFVIGLLECLTPILSVLNKPKTFEVINK
jgi:cellulose synthase/poly-beta-1,6-N-acetylglucosamine synthase-like glycosyltransferase